MHVSRGILLLKKLKFFIVFEIDILFDNDVIRFYAAIGYVLIRVGHTHRVLFGIRKFVILL